MRGTSQSAPENSLSMNKKPTLKKKFWPTLNLVTKRHVDLSFQNCLVFFGIVWFGRQVTVCVQKCYKNAIFGWSLFQKFNFNCFLLKLLIYSPSTKNIFKLVCPLLTQSSIIISRMFIPPSFWPWVTNHDVKSKISKKWFLRSSLFYTTFPWCLRVEQKT